MAESKVLAKKSRASRNVIQLTTHISGAKAVSVTGDFSGWSEKGIPMSNGSGDLWEADLVLPPGEYQYRLLVDGRWQDHEEAKKRVANCFGTENCVLFVSG